VFWSDLLEEHADEAAFLFGLRGGAFSSRAYDLESSARLEERLRAHLDGLVLGDADGWKVVEPLLASKIPGEAFVAAFVAATTGEPSRVAALAAALAAPACAEGLGWGLRLAEGEADRALERLARDEALAARALAADALAFRGRTVPPDQVAALFASGDPLAARCGVEIAGRLRMAAARPALVAHARSADPALATAALESALLAGAPEAVAACRDGAAREDAAGAAAIRLLGVAGEARDHALLARAAKSAPHARSAVLALGRHGYPASIDALIDATAERKLARAAGLALCTMLGIDLAAEQLVAEGPPPERVAVAAGAPGAGAVSARGTAGAASAGGPGASIAGGPAPASAPAPTPAPAPAPKIPSPRPWEIEIADAEAEAADDLAEDEVEEDLALDPDEGLPWPDHERLRAWWARRTPKPPPDTRLRGGQPFSWDAILAEVRSAALPDRDDALRECALRLGALPVFERRAWARDQRAAAAALVAAIAPAARGAAPGTWTTITNARG